AAGQGGSSMTKRVRLERSRKTRAEFTVEIRESWQASVTAIIRTGQLLIEAKRALPHGEWGDMVSGQLPFGERTALMLMAIARSRTLRNPKHISHLPPSWGTLYVLATLPDRQLNELLANEKISSDMTLREAKAVGYDRVDRAPKAFAAVISIRNACRDAEA